jgi:hypothetical protein
MIKKLLVSLTILTFSMISAQGNYLDFDGINDYVDIPNSGNAVANANAISMICKVYPKSNTAGFPAFNGIMGYRNETNFDFYIIQLGGNQVEARFRNSAGTAYSITYNGMTLNQWNQLFLVYNGSTLKLYNGTTEVGSVAASGSAPVSNTATLKIGLIPFQTYNWYHKGYIDEASLWNKALSPTEISAIVSNSGVIANPASETNLKLYYKFDQGSAYGNNVGVTTLIDEKATNNGAATNFAMTGTTSNWGGTILNTTDFGSNANYVYPNPTSGILYFSGYSEINAIKIIEISGRTVLNKLINGTNEVTMDVAELQSGIYVAIINDTQKIKFIKK